MKGQRVGVLLASLTAALLTVLAVMASGEKTAEKKAESPFTFHKTNYKSQQEFAVHLGRRCGTKPPSVAQRRLVHERVVAFQARNPGLADVVRTLTIPVHFHVIHSGDNGKLGDAQVQNQIKALNAAYNAHDIKFNLVDVTHTDNASWFGMDMDSAEERAAKTQLGADQKRNLNIYTANLPGGLLGWATFPWQLAGDPVKDGVVILYSSLPGGSVPYDEGKTAVHEVGHWLGLYHTFEGSPDGCADPAGDYVDDTPAQKVANYGKAPEDTDTCPKPGKDPVHNYMNYVDDMWMTEFSKGQISRLKDQVAQFRPLLIPAPTRTRIKP